MLLIKTLSNSEWYKRPRPSHTVHVHTLYLLWGLDVTTLKVFDLTELQEQPWQHIHWNMPQSNILNTSVNEPNQRCKKRMKHRPDYRKFLHRQVAIKIHN